MSLNNLKTPFKLLDFIIDLDTIDFTGTFAML